jgi:hypothetical protein
MHKFIPVQSDFYVTNYPELENKNFGRDEILEISAVKYLNRYYSTSSYQTTNTDYIGLQLMRFTGRLTGSLTGSSISSTGSIIGCGLVITSSEHC